MIIISEKDVIEESFNPTLVRLRLRDHLSQHDPDRRFNPTLVRLRQDPVDPRRGREAEFQSHAGSIEARRRRRGARRGRPGFNPTLVRLRPGSVPTMSRHSMSRFNPTLVRLRPLLGRGRVCVKGWFQSHAGSIEAAMNRSPGASRARFQSHAGSIEAIHSQYPVNAPTEFQSHAGSIEAGLRVDDRDPTE